MNLSGMAWLLVVATHRTNKKAEEVTSKLAGRVPALSHVSLGLAVGLPCASVKVCRTFGAVSPFTD